MHMAPAEMFGSQRLAKKRLDAEMKDRKKGSYFAVNGERRRGDYYFVRLRQIDGGMAWSSPVWIGGFSKRH